MFILSSLGTAVNNSICYLSGMYFYIDMQILEVLRMDNKTFDVSIYS